MLIGLFIKHIKAYKKINFIPIGYKYNFVSYIGENGIGKSSILESLNSFFNNKPPYLINKSAESDGLSGANTPYVAPIFLIEKKSSPVRKKKKEFENVSNFFWTIKKIEIPSGVQGSMKEFFDLREQLENNLFSKETHYLLVVGESGLKAVNNNDKLCFASFDKEVEHFFIKHGTYPVEEYLELGDKEGTLVKSIDFNTKYWKDFLTELKKLYSFVYLPVELEIESFTKIQTDEMQKIFDKKLKNEIGNALEKIDLTKDRGLNKDLNNFIKEIEETLNGKYCYNTGRQKSNITKTDLVDKIIEVYFQKRTLYKKNSHTLTRVGDLSAGEKRQAIVSLVFAFLKKYSSRDSFIIIGIDEPENSLHTSLCYSQFEKLKEISNGGQIFITTHWYGFLPIISKGYGHFLNKDDSEIKFNSYDLYDYKAKVKKDRKSSNNRIPQDFILKSTNDLVQSIFYSIKDPDPYNWLICEGLSEKIYFEYFLQEELSSKKLRIIPMGGYSEVVRLYKYLRTPIDEEEVNNGDGKIYCIVDTDSRSYGEVLNGKDNLVIKRLHNVKHKETKLVNLNSSEIIPTDIEQSLNPIIFKETIESLSNIRLTTNDENGNTSFIENFKNLEIIDFFKNNEGKNKIVFAKKYIKILSQKENPGNYVPFWIKEVSNFFE